MAEQATNAQIGLGVQSPYVVGPREPVQTLNVEPPPGFHRTPGGLLLKDQDDFGIDVTGEPLVQTFDVGPEQAPEGRMLRGVNVPYTVANEQGGRDQRELSVRYTVGPRGEVEPYTLEDFVAGRPDPNRTGREIRPGQASDGQVMTFESHGSGDQTMRYVQSIKEDAAQLANVGAWHPEIAEMEGRLPGQDYIYELTEDVRGKTSYSAD